MYKDSVLVVNDTPDQLELLSTLLSQAGYRVLTAADGREGFKIAQTERPHLIISDVTMSHVDGIELCRLIRGDATLRRTPVLLISAVRKDAESALEGMGAGADDFLEAPYEPMRLIAKAARLIERFAVEEHYREIVEQAVDIIYTRDIKGHLTSINEAGARFFGQPGEKLIGRHMGELLKLGDPEGFVRIAAEELGQSEQWRQQVEVKDNSGNSRWLDMSRWLMRDRRGEVVGIRGIAREITEQKQAEEALHKANQRAIREYEHLLNRVALLALALGTARELVTVFRALRDFARISTPLNGLFISLYDPDLQVRTAAYAWSDGEEVEVSTLPPMEMTDSPQSRAVSTGRIIITDDFQAAMKEKPGVNIGLDVDPRLPQSSLVVPMSVMGRMVGAVEVQSTEPAAFNMEHATALQMAANLAANAIENVRLLENERAQAEQLRQSQKLESVGQLAGGIAHDFNNLLTVITGYSDLILSRLKQDDPLRRKIEEIKTAADRAASLTRQLLAFSRKQVLEPKVLDLNDVVADTDKLLRRLIGEDIHLATMRAPGLWRIKADPDQLSQVIINLAVNARDAMPEGGKLSIEISNVHLDEAFAREHIAVQPGPYVMLGVSDTGHGMDAETQKQIFEPFFTTKEVGKGTGLGLSMVYGVVRQSGGHIWVESEEGRGTTFKIYLPRVESDVTEVQAGAPPPELPKGTETIMLVEDEEMVRRLLGNILEGAGYRVLAAADGNEALRICERHEGTIQLLMTDVVMPGMSGRQLVERLSRRCADARVLYMSGYTDNAIVHHGVLDPGLSFLQKPFTPEAVLRKVREVLDAA